MWSNTGGFGDWFHIKVPAENLSAEGRDLSYYCPLRYMPKLNTANPEVKRLSLKVSTYWIEEFDAW